MKYVNYLTTEEKFFQLSKQYSEEEACVFQLISNKKKEFFDFFTDFFIDLPGFITIYKEKFFSRIKDFIDDKNYIFDLEQKYKSKYPEGNMQLYLNNNGTNNIKKEEQKEENNLLGNKRERPMDNILLTYDTELKLLENDYPQIIDSDEKKLSKPVQIKQEKNDENNTNESSNDNNNENINNNINNNKKIINDENVLALISKKSKTHKISEYKKNNLSIEKEKLSIKHQNRSRKVDKIKFGSKENKYKARKLPNSQNTSKIRRKKGKNMSIKKSDLIKIHSTIKSYHINNSIVTNIMDGSLSKNDYSINNIREHKEYSQSSVNMLYGINSRLDKMPKINVHKKKKYEINYSAGKLLDNIKERLSNIDSKEKNSRKIKYLSDDKQRRDERIKLNQINQIVNNNFYGKERLKSPVFNDRDDTADTNNTNNENIVNCENKSNNKNRISNPKKKNSNRKSSSKSIKKKNYNKNVFVNYKIILHYKKKRGEKIITKSEFIPQSINIEKNAIDMNEVKMLFNSLFYKKAEKKEVNKSNKPIAKKKYNLRKRKKNATKIIRSKKTIIPKSRAHLRKLRKSTRLQNISKIQNSKDKKNKPKKDLRRKSKLFKRIKSKKQNKKTSVKKSEERAYESRSDSLFKAGNVRTNCQNDIDIENYNDQILVNKTEHIDSRIEEEIYSNRGSVKKNNVNNNKIDYFDTISGFNYLYSQK